MSHFFAYISKMKFIIRWGLMRNAQTENIQEHSLQVAMIAHNLAVIKNRLFDGDVDPERTAVLGMYHDVGEVITGDLASPIKYFNPKIKDAYEEIEVVAKKKLIGMLPLELQKGYQGIFDHAEEDEACWALVKAADKICAYIKCLEEIKAGNQEFSRAKDSIQADIASLHLPEVEYFMTNFIASFSLTLDELN